MRMEPRGRLRHRWANRKVEWAERMIKAWEATEFQI